LVDGLLVSGDTLFLDGCGRTDLPGSDAEAMFDSLQRLAGLPDDVVVYPGHRYSVASTGTLEAIKATNYVFKPKTREQWLTMFAGV
jgi:glyoxylase-like metal-dependent hydrolase (beta-lactamase superfamily II)